MRNIFILVLVILAVGLVAYGFQQSQNNKVVEENQIEMNNNTMMVDEKIDNDVMMEDDTMTGDDAMMVKEGGEYLAYSPELLARANSGDVVLFFHAAWCPTCKALESDINRNLENIPDDLTILKINYDKESELKKKYDVVIQHTLVKVDANGNELAKWTGGNDLDSIIKHL